MFWAGRCNGSRLCKVHNLQNYRNQWNKTNKTHQNTIWHISFGQEMVLFGSSEWCLPIPGCEFRQDRVRCQEKMVVGSNTGHLYVMDLATAKQLCWKWTPATRIFFSRFDNDDKRGFSATWPASVGANRKWNGLKFIRWTLWGQCWLFTDTNPWLDALLGMVCLALWVSCCLPHSSWASPKVIHSESLEVSCVMCVISMFFGSRVREAEGNIHSRIR